MVFQNDILAGSSGASGTSTTVHTIGQSIRFNDDDNAVLSRTISSTSSTTTNTISMWVKRGNLGNSRSGSGSDVLGQTLFQSGRNASNFFEVNFGGTTAGAIGTSENALRISSITGDSIIMKLNTTAIFRDTSAWYNIVAVVDTTNDVASERLRLYVNGNRQTDFTSTTFPSKDTETELFRNTSNVLSVGAWVNPSESVRYFDGYMAEITVINGQALDPSSFGLYNDSNIWIPKDVSGLTFGTNGFHLKGETASDLGNDSSSNNNDFTTSGLASHDQVTDTPTDNFCTLNPLDERGSGTLSNGDLQMAFGATNDNVTGTLGMSSGKWYWEVYIVDKDDPYVGVQDSGVASTGYTVNAVALWVDGGYVYENNSDTGDRSTTYTNGDIVGVAFDVDNKKIWWSKNGQWYSADDSSTATINISEVIAGNQAQVITRSPGFFIPFVGNYNTGTVIMNFGQEGTFAGNVTAGNNTDGDGNGNFKYTVPTGFKTLKASNIY